MVTKAKALRAVGSALLLLGMLQCDLRFAHADDLPTADCSSLPSHEALKSALITAKSEANGGYGHEMWGVTVNRDGAVCAVAFTGSDRGQQWPGSRLIAAAKAFTANAYSLPKFAISTANLYFATQPSGPLFGLANGNRLDSSAAYLGNPADFGRLNDPLVGRIVGGTIVFGGGLPLYNKDHVLTGALGVSGDTSCADHNVAWRTRHTLGFDFVPEGVTSDKSHPDSIVYDVVKLSGHPNGVSPSGWGHPACSSDVPKITQELPPTAH